MMKTIRRRRLEKKTDYKSRLSLLKSNKLRLVIRKTNKYILAQAVETNVAQDSTIMAVTSKDLLSKGWPEDKSGSLKSKSAAYLTGLLLGRLLKGKLKQDLILDIGMHRNIKKSRIYAVLKGVLDSGLNINHDAKILPSVEEIKSKKELNAIFEKVKEKI